MKNTGEPKTFNSVFPLEYFSGPVVLAKAKNFNLSENNYRNGSDKRCNGEAKARQTPKRKLFCMWWPQTVDLSLSFLTDSYLVLCSANVLVTTSSMRLYIQPNQVAQVVQLLQDGTSIRVAARRFAVSPHSL